MKRYIVNINSITNILGGDDFFLGTGFLGAQFDTFEELKKLLVEYATYEKEGKRYWRKVIKMTFALGSTISSIKKEGDRQCEENGMVELFSLAAAYRKDPLTKYTIYFRPSKWQDSKGVFSFLLQEDGKDPVPKYGKFSEILKEIGIVL